MKPFLFHLVIVTIIFSLPYSALAAKYTKAGKKYKGKIQIENARLLKRDGLSEYVSMTLEAKDRKPLHEGQVYTLKKLKASDKTAPDGDYNELIEILFINFLIQGKTLRHQTTLRLVKEQPMEFEIVEKTTTTLQAKPKTKQKTFYRKTATPSIHQLLPPPRLDMWSF